MEKNVPLFSIIVPVYDVEQYLNQCLNSIVRQSFENFELLLIVDETTPDNCMSIAIRYSQENSRIKVYKRAHMGLSDARNYGAESACGDYLIFIDSDDFLDDMDYLEEIAKAIEKYEPDYVITRYQKCNEAGDRRYPVGMSRNQNRRQAASQEERLIELLNSGYFQVSAWAKAVKRSFFEEKKLWFAEGYSEDIDWTARILQCAGSIEILNLDSYVYRIRKNSLSHKYKLKQCLDLGRRITDWGSLISGRTEFEKAQLGYLSYQYFIYIAILHFLPKEEQKTVWRQERQLAYLKQYAFGKKERAAALLCKLFGKKAGSYLLYLDRKSVV